MNFTLKPVAAAALAVCLVGGPVVATAHAKAKPATSHYFNGNAFTLSTPLESFAFGIINRNSTQSYAPGWSVNHRLTISGLLNLDAKYSDRSPLGRVPGFSDHETSDIYVNNVNLMFDAKITANGDVRAHLGLAHLSDSINNVSRVVFLRDRRTNKNRWALVQRVTSRGGTDSFWEGRTTVDEAYILLSRFKHHSGSPYYLKAGKMYVSFGDNPDVYPLTYSLTQLLTQTRGTAVEVGGVTAEGFFANVYVMSSTGAGRNQINSVGAKLGFKGAIKGIDTQVDVSYLNDMRSVDYLDQARVNWSFASSTGPRTNKRLTRDRLLRQAGGIDVHGGVYFGDQVGPYHQYFVSAEYVTALRDIMLMPPGVSSKLWAVGVQGGIAFMLHDRASLLTIGYQGSGNANFAPSPFSLVAALLPQDRFIANYTWNLFTHMRLGFEYIYDENYSSGNSSRNVIAKLIGTENDHASTAAVRLSVAL